MFVNDLWMPENNPPQINSGVAVDLQAQIKRHGAIAVANGARSQFEATQHRLDVYLDEFGFDLNDMSSEGFWPAWALRFGAALASLGYMQSKEAVTIDKTFDLSRELAELQGLPETYVISMYGDQRLLSVLRTVFEYSDLQTDDGQGLEQISIIGAGCVRFHMQEALLAA